MYIWNQEINMEQNKFIQSNSISKEEFIAQFSDTSEEILIKVLSCWKKGDMPFKKFGKESLASLQYNNSWVKDKSLATNYRGYIYWFTKKSLFGYPYKPEFKPNICYRVRVRRVRPDISASYNYFLLEEVIEENVDMSKDDTLYNEAYNSFLADYDQKVQELLIYVTKDLDMSKETIKKSVLVAWYHTKFSAVTFMDTNKSTMIEGSLRVPCDNRNFAGNKTLKFKAGKVYKVTARHYTGDNNSNAYLLDKVIEENVNDALLATLGTEAQKPSTWNVEGVGEFDVKHSVATTIITWDDNAKCTDAEIELDCDKDNPKTASAATAHLLKIMQNKSDFTSKVFTAIADHLADENGMIETWEGESQGDVHITRDEFIKRLSLTFIYIDVNGSGSVLVNLDGMFTDHGYEVFFGADGTFEANGLMG